MLSPGFLAKGADLDWGSRKTDDLPNLTEVLPERDRRNLIKAHPL